MKTDYNHKTKFRAKKDTRVFVRARNRTTIYLVPLEKGELFKLRRGQDFYGDKPSELKETRW